MENCPFPGFWLVAWAGYGENNFNFNADFKSNSFRLFFFFWFVIGKRHFAFGSRRAIGFHGSACPAYLAEMHSAEKVPGRFVEHLTFGTPPLSSNALTSVWFTPRLTAGIIPSPVDDFELSGHRRFPRRARSRHPKRSQLPDG